MQNMRGCYERPQNNINIEKIKEHQMSLEQTIKDTVIAESHDLDGRLQQLVRAGLMPANTIPILRKAIGKVQGGMTLQGAERDVMATFINSMMFIVLGDDAIFNRARSGAKGYATEETEDDGWYTHSQIHGSMKSEKHPKGISAAEWKSGIRWHHGKNKRINIKEETDLDENAKVAAHLIKRYGENVRQSHVRSAAADLGVDASKLSKAVRKKLGKTMLPEAKEKTEYDYEGDMAMGQLKSIIANSQRMHDMLSDDTNLPEWVQSKITLAEDYISTASNYMQGEMSEEKIDEVAPLLAVAGVAGRMVASRLAAKAGAGVATRAIAGAAGSAAASSAVKKFSSTKETNEEIDKDLENELKATRVTKKSMDDSKKTRERASGMKEEAIEEKRGLWDNIHAKRKRIKAGSGERMRKPGSDGAPSAADLKASQTEEVEQIDEISKATAGRYINKAKDSIDTTSWRQGYREAAGKPLSSFEKKLTKRHKGISMAVKKLTKEDIEAVKSMHESYKNTFNAALEHYNIKSPSELGEDKRKEFFNHVDQKFKKGDN
jgi:hypothetical protein